MRKANEARGHGRRTVLRRLPILMTLLLAPLALTGCDESVTCVDEPPAVPTGVFSVTGDGVVSVYWNDLYQLDLVGYRVYRHDGVTPETGPYYFQGVVAWDENYDDQTLLHWYDDHDVVNGETYYYAVLAYDEGGNESELSFETVGDTPRPEGIEVLLYDRDGAYPDRSGFDFSLLAMGRLPWNEPTADIYVDFDGGVPFVVSARPAAVKIQDYGACHWDDAGYAPGYGYSEVGTLELIEGHCYFVKIIDDPETAVHYAKFQVYAVEEGYVDIDWAYQIDPFNPELKTPADESDRRGVEDRIVRF